MLSLREAVRQFTAIPGVTVNAFDWYRRAAKARGEVAFAKTTVPVHKHGRVWVVSEKDFLSALKAHDAARRRVAKATAACETGVLIGKDGETIHTTGGGYHHKGRFHLVWSDSERYKRRSDGSWICSGCCRAATTHHDRSPCHRCEDWGGCGKDCTLTAVSCKRCGTHQAIP
jgi:hypothetical protein